MIGKTISHYRITAILGTGGMGSVYVAEDLKLGRKVALKVLPTDLAGHPERLERFQREARAIAALNHPNIVTVYSVEQAEGQHFITMELVEGKTLGQVIAAGASPLSRILALGCQIADALATAHSQGVIHRDLKPSNVMVDAEDRVKVIDFGLAKLRDTAGSSVDLEAPTVPLTMAGRILGTPAYMSPEQLNGKEVDPRADLFALGIILFELCTGQRPFAGDSAMAIASSILKDPPTDVQSVRPDVPPDLAHLIRRCLHKKPEERTQTAMEIRNELKEFRARLVSGTLTASHMVVPTVRTGNQAVWKTVAITLVAVAIGVGLWLNRDGESRSQDSDAQATTGRASTPYRFVAPEPWSSESAAEEWPAVSFDGKQVVYSQTVGGFQKLFLRDLARTQPAIQLTTGNTDDIQPAWSPDGQTLAFVRANSNTGKIQPSDIYGGFYYAGGEIWTLQLKDRKAVRIVEEAFNPTFNRKGLIAYDAFLDKAKRIWTCDIEGRGKRPVTEDSDKVGHMEPSWSPDGQRIAFVRQDQKYSARIAVVDLQTRSIRDLTKNLYLSEPTWSPSGNSIVVSANLSSGFNLWRLPVSPTGKVLGPFEPLTTGAGRDLHPAFTPDGKSLTYSILGWNSDIWCMPMDPVGGKLAGQPKPLLTSSREDTRAAASADEKSIVFTSDREGYMNLWVADFDTTTGTVGAPWRITSGPGGDYQAQWMPKGDAVVFFSMRAGNEDIWLQHLDEKRRAVGTPVQLTRHPDRDVNPFPSPDGRLIAFQTERTGGTELWTVKPDGTGEAALSRVSAGGHFTPWLSTNAIAWHGDRVFLDGRPPEKFLGFGGAHLSFSPDHRFVLENDHTAVYLAPATPATDRKSMTNVFQFTEPNVGIDYTVWLPSGKWALMDRNTPTGGDIFLLRNLE